jgi:small subunit ribosomal protein S9
MNAEHAKKEETAVEGKTYIETVGRRKTSVARVRITPSAKNTIVVNEKELAVYFPTKELQATATDAILKSKITSKFKVTAVIKGGGINSQAEALRHGISRGLVEYDAELRKRLKKMGFLKRDPRAKERRKFGLKKARKAPQWSKR